MLPRLFWEEGEERCKDEGKVRGRSRRISPGRPEGEREGGGSNRRDERGSDEECRSWR